MVGNWEGSSHGSVGGGGGDDGLAGGLGQLVLDTVTKVTCADVENKLPKTTTEHCVDNPKIIEVPVEVEHCHTVTKVTCADVENKLPKTTCEAVVTSATSH